MKEEKAVKENFDLIKKELNTLTDKMEGMDTALRELDDLKIEIKGLRLSLGRVHPEFTAQFPEIRKMIRNYSNLLMRTPAKGIESI